MDEQIWYVYLLECKNKRIYTGVSPNVDNRVHKHSIGKGALFTRINQPEKLIAQKAFKSKREALQIERQVKKMPAIGKRILAKIWNEESDSTSDEVNCGLV